MALEKLNMPPPSRPSTSLGFVERAKGGAGSDDDGDEGSGRSEDRMQVDVGSGRLEGSKKRKFGMDDSVVGVGGGKVRARVEELDHKIQELKYVLLLTSIIW